MGELVRSEQTLSTNFVQSIRRFIFSNEFVLLPLFLFAFISSCTNVASLKNRLPSSINDQVSPSVDDAGGMFNLSTVLPSQATTGNYDLIGTNSEFDTYCGDSQNPNSKCKCEYAYTQTGIGPQTVQGNIVYQESNLVRCENQVPSGINSFTVKVVTIDGASYSNPQTVTLSGGTFSNSTHRATLTLN